jgi:tetratricopeptide (TPR) repeat protein
MTDDEQTPSNDGPTANPEQDATILKAYRNVAGLCRWLPGEGQEAVEARIKLSSAFNRLAELEESEGRNSEGLAARESATSMIRQAQQITGEHVTLRLMEAAQLNSRGFTLREMENWTDALDIYTELAELMDDGANGTPWALYLMASAQDGIGDVQDTLGDPAARDAAWERARALFQSCIHATKTNADPEYQMDPPQSLLDAVIAKQQEFL